MKNLTAFFLLFCIIGSFPASAIGLPNNAYIQKKSVKELTEKKELKPQSNKMTDKYANENYEEAAEKDEALSSSIANYTQSLIDKLVNAISQAFMSLFSTNQGAVAEQLPLSCPAKSGFYPQI